MIPWYLLALVGALLCLGLVDWRYKLALFHDWRRTLLTVLIAVGLFVVWDALGIYSGIFFYGGSPLVLPARLFPQFPIEEIFFLTLLTYSTLIAYRAMTRRAP